ncbi:hypothetical protein KC19_4G078900 [Ceratodon purpureus]|uniref:Secreted protein n=1 Tax=Ceratodon purpureus TaxID=3225 RepID=A0A8T0I6P9_CERPU|nr:hypothetical protein KC19_4G078900 [Ceratodon purpureus]
MQSSPIRNTMLLLVTFLPRTLAPIAPLPHTHVPDHASAPPPPHGSQLFRLTALPAQRSPVQSSPAQSSPRETSETGL